MLLKFAVILLLAAVCINAEEETPQNGKIFIDVTEFAFN